MNSELKLLKFDLYLLKDKDDIIYGYLEVEENFDIMRLKGMTLTEATTYLLENNITFRSRTGYPPTIHFREEKS